MVRRWLLTTLAALVALGVGGAGPEAMRFVDQACGAAAGDNRAVVIVDTGSQVRRVCVRFGEESISGREALVRAGVEPVFKEYGSTGSFVCKLLDTGCPASDCPCDTSEYWVYSRARAGSSTFTTSSLGVSSTRVRDGDVEGWKWATGGAPAYASPDAVCGPKPAPTTSAPATGTPPPAGGGAGGTATTVTGGAARGGPATSPVTGTGAGTATDPVVTSTTTPPDEGAVDDETADTSDDGEGGRRATEAAGAASDGGGGSPGPLAGFAVAAGLLTSAWAAARKARRRHHP